MRSCRLWAAHLSVSVRFLPVRFRSGQLSAFGKCPFGRLRVKTRGLRVRLSRFLRFWEQLLGPKK